MTTCNFIYVLVGKIVLLLIEAVAQKRVSLPAAFLVVIEYSLIVVPPSKEYANEGWHILRATGWKKK